jgi:hypothetical protein
MRAAEQINHFNPLPKPALSPADAGSNAGRIGTRSEDRAYRSCCSLRQHRELAVTKAAVRTVLSFLEHMPSRDTTSAAEKMQDDIHRRCTPADRLRMAMEMSEFARALSKAGLRARRPDLTDSELDAEMIYVMYGIRPREK